MATCRTCSTQFPDALGACPQCRTPLSGAVATRPGDDETRMAPGATSAPSSGKAATPATGWLSSSGAIDHGRFPPGTLLGGRYRIVGRLGRGGMGEVYRADDLKLGQPVALKFLPLDVDRDPARLTQLHTEVRMARQVSHPHVCRVYDIDEVDGHTFLSMEYVDGEDLSSLLRRIGRFPTDRALELARQMCAGLAAAHERGVVHRDFKPANVMIDGAGKVRITDFGLAGAIGEAIHAGTPAYMAPEQMAGQQVTARSDIYALGLVLYELFTGRRALEGTTIAEIVRQREEGGIPPPSEVVRDLDPAIDRAVLRCLERAPEHRPASALAVAAALPGGDPLAAALAAGETPSPEMVAAAGSSSALSPLTAVAALAATLVCLLGIAAAAGRTSVLNLIPASKPPAVLRLGYVDAPADTAAGFSPASDYYSYATTHGGAFDRARLASGQPPLVYYWRRTSPTTLVPTGDRSGVSYSDPPHTISGMTALQLDTEGRLLQFMAVPPQVPDTSSAPAAPPWPALFDAAGLDMRQFTAIPPEWTPRMYSDARAGWEGPMPNWPDLRLRVEAAAYRGRVVDFQMIAPWTRPARMPATAVAGPARWLEAIVTGLVMAVLFGALLVARHNWRKGRGDRRGALRLAATVLVVALGSWLLGATHVPILSTEIGRFFGGQGTALWSAAVTWVLYIALEPYVRRFWPTTLITWSRLISGDFFDPQVGRDVLIGCLFGAGLELLERAATLLLPLFGYSPHANISFRMSDLDGLRYLMASSGNAMFNALFNALWCIFGIVILRLILRRVWLTALVALLFFLFTSASGFGNSPGPGWLGAVIGTIVISAILWLVLRFGLLATSVYFFFSFFVSQAALTLDPGRWFFVTSAWTLAAAAAMALYGFYAARGGAPLLGRKILD